jgi:hypothetical protein
MLIDGGVSSAWNWSSDDPSLSGDDNTVCGGGDAGHIGGDAGVAEAGDTGYNSRGGAVMVAVAKKMAPWWFSLNSVNGSGSEEDCLGGVVRTGSLGDRGEL